MITYMILIGSFAPNCCLFVASFYFGSKCGSVQRVVESNTSLPRLIAARHRNHSKEKESHTCPIKIPTNQTTHHLYPSPRNHHSYPNYQYSQSSNTPNTVVAYSSSIPTATVSTCHQMRLFLLPVLQSSRIHHLLD
jgi:hypothetical protein